MGSDRRSFWIQCPGSSRRLVDQVGGFERNARFTGSCGPCFSSYTGGNHSNITSVEECQFQAMQNHYCTYIVNYGANLIDEDKTTRPGSQEVFRFPSVNTVLCKCRTQIVHCESRACFVLDRSRPRCRLVSSCAPSGSIGPYPCMLVCISCNI